jgi:hypothetical protein
LTPFGTVPGSFGGGVCLGEDYEYVRLGVKGESAWVIRDVVFRGLFALGERGLGYWLRVKSRAAGGWGL